MYNQKQLCEQVNKALSKLTPLEGTRRNLVRRQDLAEQSMRFGVSERKLINVGGFKVIG